MKIRNNLIIDAIKDNIERKILVLTDRIEHINILENFLQKENIDFICVHGSQNKKNKWKYEFSKIKIIDFSNHVIFWRGIDFPHLNTIMFCHTNFLLWKIDSIFRKNWSR